MWKQGALRNQELITSFQDAHLVASWIRQLKMLQNNLVHFLQRKHVHLLSACLSPTGLCPGTSTFPDSWQLFPVWLYIISSSSKIRSNILLLCKFFQAVNNNTLPQTLLHLSWNSRSWRDHCLLLFSLMTIQKECKMLFFNKYLQDNLVSS